MSKKVFSVFLFVLFLFTGMMIAEEITLHVPFIVDTPKSNDFFHELLETAIQEAGYTPNLIIEELPQVRAVNYLDTGRISIYWQVESADRNEKYIPIKVGITNGLIGRRILFIRPEDQPIYETVSTLDEFRALEQVGGMGMGWFDAKVWAANDLLYKEKEGNWKTIYQMIEAGRDYDYFPRGLNEIVAESADHPELAIEKHLVLIYDRDFLFYLSKTGEFAGASQEDKMTEIMIKAQESGLIERLVRKYWANDFESLDYDNRVKIKLATPK